MAVSIKWCCKQSNGIKIDIPNDNLAGSYIKMAENAIGTMNRERSYNRQFAISACYYSMYYSLYAVLMKIGIKCEIHSCTLEFMKKLLKDFYSTDDMKKINKAFEARDKAQYYINKIVTKEEEEFIMAQAPLFLSKSKDILEKINENDIQKIRDNLRDIVKSSKLSNQK